MTTKSARSQVERRGKSADICMATAIDVLMPVSELPDEYYDACTELVGDPNGDYNKLISYILKDFFKVEPMSDTDLAAVAKFNAFGASPQQYMPDAPYEYSDEDEPFLKRGVTTQQIRFVKLLEIARDNGCNILFTNRKESEAEHVSGLQMIDEGGTPDAAYYVVRDFANIVGDKIYHPSELAGIPQTLGNSEATHFAPLPTVRRSYFPGDQASYELLIVPADPML